MKCFLDGASVDAACLTYREIGAEAPDHLVRKLSIETTVRELVSLLDERYASLVSELHRDVEVTGDVQDCERAILENPTIEAFLARAPELLEAAFMTFLWGDFLEASFGRNPREGLRYVADRLEHVSIGDGRIAFAADAFPIRSSSSKDAAGR